MIPVGSAGNGRSDTYGMNTISGQTSRCTFMTYFDTLMNDVSILQEYEISHVPPLQRRA
jgi:hypothetical protein